MNFYYTKKDIRNINIANYSLSISDDFKEVKTNSIMTGKIFEQYLAIDAQKILNKDNAQILKDAARKINAYLALLPVHKNRYLFALIFIKNAHTVTEITENILQTLEAEKQKKEMFNADLVAKHIIHYELFAHIHKFYNMKLNTKYELNFPEFEEIITEAIKKCPYTQGPIDFRISKAIDYKVSLYRTLGLTDIPEAI